MTGTEKIIAHIEADAKARTDQILAAAAEQCEAIRSQYEQKAADLYQTKIREGVKACQDQEDGALRISRMEARKSTLAVKQDAVAKAFEMAQEQILALPKEQYVAFLADLVKKAGAAGDEEILLSERDRGEVADALLKAVNADGAHFTIPEETKEISGGLVLRRGNVETNCSVELLIDLCRAELSSKLADVLFG